ncbi:uncharacterized protein K489DRAFT_366383 [Dissoconium aciculare CBS 342.82]|uniref:Uncharacterized protein n=1 Tax=Dissoconium aciculare CBS 342.82 TaxID=1314786 RepID=A0A6J3MH48_9PEZI|nr:uncharacterized protein K489DRAFT_366383 [Dissoconium aciculare CBS 342.82]KAF1827198.1 hypothetical protein K489DRAFT_366383 [Dissoconium aciculare CBS 342.82]
MGHGDASHQNSRVRKVSWLCSAQSAAQPIIAVHGCSQDRIHDDDDEEEGGDRGWKDPVDENDDDDNALQSKLGIRLGRLSAELSSNRSGVRRPCQAKSSSFFLASSLALYAQWKEQQLLAAGGRGSPLPPSATGPSCYYRMKEVLSGAWECTGREYSPRYAQDPSLPVLPSCPNS